MIKIMFDDDVKWFIKWLSYTFVAQIILIIILMVYLEMIR